MLPSVRASPPVTVRVVPAATVYVEPAPLNTTSVRLWLPLIVIVAANTTVEVPGSRVPAVYVQLRPVRMVPTSVSVPDGLLITRLGRLPAAVVEAPVNVWAPAPLMSSVPVPPSNVAAWLIGPWAATVPVLMLPSVNVSEPTAVRVSPAATVFSPAVKRTSLNASDVATSIVAAPVTNATVPPFGANDPPPVWV